ncbi:unnamed protein product [Phytomonas sp. Hart1]|nr:unnamed protein product [Phytomonas sp. Hart1]|eukprot:CCW70191.1 unnamed protein product [Phytomonas sp. isolate Hart1]
MIKARDDPWPNVAKHIETMLAELTEQLQRLNDMGNPTIIAENEVLDAIANCKEVVEDMRFAYDSAVEHPESFSIPVDELERRAMCLCNWEQNIEKMQRAGGSIRSGHRARLQNNGTVLKNSKSEANDFMVQEFKTQRHIMQSDEQTLERLSGGIQRVKETAVNINEEMVTQEHVLNDIDRGMFRVQTRLGNTAKRVSQLIEKTSDRGKMICITVLFLILIVLIFFILK